MWRSVPLQRVLPLQTAVHARTSLATCLARCARRCGKCSCACSRCRALGVCGSVRLPSLTVIVGRYRPADQDPTKESFNSRAGRHPLGHRARKLDQGILVVRFELPFNIWCDACQNHIGQGVRYNAEKKQVGSYYTTPIWSFRCKCHLCQNWFEIRTDPQVRDECLCSLWLTSRTRATLLPPVPASRSVSRIASWMQLARAPRKRGTRSRQPVMHSHS